MFSAGIAKSVQQFKTTGSEMASSIESLGASATNANVPLEMCIRDSCYMEDDQTVTKTGTGASVAGLVIRVDDEGVAVEMGFGLTAPAAAAK